MLTVAALKGILKDLPDDMPVVLSADSEGNKFRGLGGYSMEIAEDPESYYLEIYSLEDVEDSEVANVVVLWP